MAFIKWYENLGKGLKLLISILGNIFSTAVRLLRYIFEGKNQKNLLWAILGVIPIVSIYPWVLDTISIIKTGQPKDFTVEEAKEEKVEEAAE